jgi:hypothetical protein
MAFTLRSLGGGSFGMGDWDGGWMCQSEAKSCWVYFDLYIYKGVKYLKVNQPGSKWHGYYLSVNNNGYLGLYSWSGASGWALSSDGQLLCQYNGNAVRVDRMNQAHYFQTGTYDTDPVYFPREYNPDLYAALA